MFIFILQNIYKSYVHKLQLQNISWFNYFNYKGSISVYTQFTCNTIFNIQSSVSILHTKSYVLKYEFVFMFLLSKLLTVYLAHII